MPIYEYICADCREKSEVKATFAQKQGGLKVVCPKCNSKKMIRVFGSFIVRDSSRTSNNPPICGPQCGPGCCG